ncbi:hypothetical protein AAAC51_04225 [Priestia megaterium]
MSNFTKDEELIIHKAIDVFGQKDRIEDYSDERKSMVFTLWRVKTIRVKT